MFKVLSEEGAAEARRICLELKQYAEQDERSCKLRSDFLKLVQILESRTDPKFGPGFEITKNFVHDFVHEKNRARFHDSCTIKKLARNRAREKSCTIFLVKNEF